MRSKAWRACLVELFRVCTASVSQISHPIVVRAGLRDVLRAPTPDNSRKAHLFRVVGDERAELEYGTSIVSIWALHDVRCSHGRAKRTENLRQRRVV